MAIFDSAGYAAQGIQCQDGEGFVSLPDSLPIRISTDSNRDAMLVYKSYGLIPEPYAHYVDGVEQDGVYLGIAGKTPWAFSQETGSNGVSLWKARLLLGREDALNGDALRDGEIEGFLTAASG